MFEAAAILKFSVCLKYHQQMLKPILLGKLTKSRLHRFSQNNI